jgi:hypothetical protein
MKLLILIASLLIVTSALADTTLSRDGEGLKIQGGAFATLRSTSVGTKGFACFSTLTKTSWEIKVADATGTISPFKMFYNGIEFNSFPVTDRFFQFQNAPSTKSPTLSKVCLRAYSSQSVKIAHGVFQ